MTDIVETIGELVALIGTLLALAAKLAVLPFVVAFDIVVDAAREVDPFDRAGAIHDYPEIA